MLSNGWTEVYSRKRRCRIHAQDVPLSAVTCDANHMSCNFQRQTSPTRKRFLSSDVRVRQDRCLLIRMGGGNEYLAGRYTCRHPTMERTVGKVVDTWIFQSTARACLSLRRMSRRFSGRSYHIKVLSRPPLSGSTHGNYEMTRCLQMRNGLSLCSKEAQVSPQATPTPDRMCGRLGYFLERCRRSPISGIWQSEAVLAVVGRMVSDLDVTVSLHITSIDGARAKAKVPVPGSFV